MKVVKKWLTKMVEKPIIPATMDKLEPKESSKSKAKLPRIAIFWQN